MKEAELVHVADDSTIYVCNKCESAINWLKTNNMIVNPNKFQLLIISSKKDLSKSFLKINGAELTMESSVKLLGIEIDNKMNIEKNISSISKKASNQLNAICRLQTFLGHKEKEALISTFVHSNFNYGGLIWHFSSKKSKNKVEKSHERSLKSLSNAYLSSYAERLEKFSSVSMETKGLCTIVFKTLNNLNPVFMIDIFHYSPNVTHRKHNLYIHTQNATKFGDKKLRAFDANIWNTLPEYIKLTTSLLEFQQFIKTWRGPTYKCSVCK